MTTLSQGMYGDPNCRAFGLHNGQTKPNALVYNAGWYSDKGEKLGSGDLTIDDMIKINSGLKGNDKFIILSESETSSIPSNLNRLSPGIQLVLDKCSWMISQAEIFKIDNKQKEEQKIFHTNGTDVVKISRDYLFSLCCRDSSIASVVIKPGIYFGLDLYIFADGLQYATGTHEECWQAAMYSAQESLWTINPLEFSKYMPLSAQECDCILFLQEELGHGCNSLIAKTLGKYIIKVCDGLVKKEGMANYLSRDNRERSSNDISGLPKDLLAFFVLYNDGSKL